MISGIGYVLLCQALSFPESLSLLLMGITFLIAAAIPWQFAPSAASEIEFALFMTLVTPFYLAKQFVLGFPDRDQMVSLPEPPPPVEVTLPTVHTGTTVSALRPMGTVEFGGEHFTATTLTGRMIAAGRAVRWTGYKGHTLLVDELPHSATPP